MKRNTCRYMTIKTLQEIITLGNIKSRLYLHKEFIETPMRVGSPPLLKSILSLVIWRFIKRLREWYKSVYSKYELFIEKISSEECSKYILSKHISNKTNWYNIC